MEGGVEEMEITWQLEVWDVADGGGTEWSPAASGRGRRWRPNLGEVFQNVDDGGYSSMKARTVSSTLHPCSELQRGKTQTPWRRSSTSSVCLGCSFCHCLQLVHWGMEG
jgi:hypothetical protein